MKSADSIEGLGLLPHLENKEVERHHLNNVYRGSEPSSLGEEAARRDESHAESADY